MRSCVRFITFAGLFLFVPFLAYCASSEKDAGRFPGTWIFEAQGARMTLVVDAGGRYTMTVRTEDGEESTRGTWRMKDGSLVTRDEDGEVNIFRYRFISDDELEVVEPGEGTYRFKRRGGGAKPVAPSGGEAGPAPVPAPGKEGVAPLKRSATGHIVFTRYGKRRVAGGGLNEEVPLPQLWVVNGDGTEAHRFFPVKDEGFVIAKDPRWGPDYREIAFTSNYRSSFSACMEDIFVAGADGSSLRRITGNEMRVVVPPKYGSVTGIIIDNMRSREQVSKSWAQINITAQGAGGVIHHPSPARNMSIMNRDTGQLMTKVRAWRFKIPRVLAGTKVWIKVWSGKYVGNVKVVQVAADGVTDVGNFDLNHGLYYAAEPSLCRGGRYVFGRGSIASLQETPGKPAQVGGADSICAYDRNTGAVAAMFEPTRMAGENAKFPAVSPDGRFVAICWGQEGAESLALLPVADFLANRARPRVIVAGQRVLFPPSLQGAASPAWSPDGKLIAFAKSVMTTGFVTANIAVVNADGTGFRLLTNVGTNQLCTHPCFSPDGRRVAFTVLTGKFGMIRPEHLAALQVTADIYSVNLDGTGLRRITDDGISAQPAWGL